MRYSVFLLLLINCLNSSGQYTPVSHRTLLPGEIPVSGAGVCGIPGKTYVLVNDISAKTTALFLSGNSILDLNGYTITFADANYKHIPNYGFENGLEGWDISRAPGAKIVSTEEHAFIGKNILHLGKGDEIVSEFIYLPEANRSYCAICGVTGRYYQDMNGDLSKDMKVSVFIEDEQGNAVVCRTAYGDSVLTSCPVLGRSPRLGGGFVFVHMNNKPAGKYRVRIRAENDCLVDEVDLRPAMDAGIGIVKKTHPYGHNDHLYNNYHTAFFDYTAEAKTGKPVKSIPVVHGAGSVIIKNGIIKNGTTGFISHGILSTADSTRVILDNVKIISSGINSTSVDVEQATITNCTFETDNPFIINRHGSEFYGVDLRGSQPSEVSFSEFYGGQGCLSFKGPKSVIHHNLFVNRQTVTNHYSIMAMGDGSKIFSNTFRPETGSGIEIFRKKYIEIFDNEFHINAAPPSCEYNDQLSTNAIRIADYGAAKGAENGAFGNKVYNNRFYISGRKYDRYPSFIPVATAFFYSASAGDNEIFGNRIEVHQQDPESNAEALAFYVGNASSGKIYDNQVVSNVTPVWIGNPYGNAEGIVFSGNIIEASQGTDSSYAAIRMGPEYKASGIELRSNEFRNNDFRIDASGKPHSYILYWKISLKLTDKSNRPLADAEVSFHDVNGKETIRCRSDHDGIIECELPEVSVQGQSQTNYSPYTIVTGRQKFIVILNHNTEKVLRINSVK